MTTKEERIQADMWEITEAQVHRWVENVRKEE